MHSTPLNSNSELKFWILFFTLNAFIFLPGYLLDSGAHRLFPYEGFLSGSIRNRVDFLFKREHSDLFRLSIDVFILTGAVYMFKNFLHVKLSSRFFFTGYLCILSYQIYHQCIEKIYHVTPTMYNDFDLIAMGFSLFFNDLSMSSLIITIVTATFLFFLFYLVRILVTCLYSLEFGITSNLIIIVLSTAACISVGIHGFPASSAYGFQSNIPLAVQNVRLSYEVKKSLGSFGTEKFLHSNDYEKYTLQDRPDIYFLFIESYGRILLDNPDFSHSYQEYIMTSEQMLRDKHWHVASHLSRSPVSGGRSWLSYATVLYGYNFRNEETYQSLLNNPVIYHYTHVLRFLQVNGYRNYRLKSIYPGYYNMPEATETSTRFYAVDQWIRFKDLQYTGALHGFGPSPNDQYALHFAYHFMKERNGHAPYTLFFLNQNSHRPFYSPESVADNWQTLNDGSIDYDTASQLLATSTKEDYSRAIRFQIDYLTDFILKNGDQDDIFILMGDHQPPLFTDVDSGFETPVHIISKDSSFVNSFVKYGFTKGMLVPDREENINHEGFYSMFIRELVRHYGKEYIDLPVYRPRGVEF